MPYGSQAHVGIGKETTWGTPVAATDYIRFASESLNEEIEQVLSETMQGVFEEGPSHEGQRDIAGDISFDVYPNVIGHLLRSALGAPVTTSLATGVYQHVFTPVQSNFSHYSALPPYTLEVHRDLEQAFQYTGALVNDLTFSFGTDQKIMQGTAAIIAKSLALITKTTPSFENGNPFLWHQAKISIDTIENKDIQTLEFGVNNSLEGRYSVNQTKVVSRILRSGNRTFPVNFTFDLKDLTEYNKFRAQNEVAVKVEFTGSAIDGTNNYKLTIDMPKFRFATFPVNVDGSGALTAQVDGSAKYDNASAHAMKITLVNTTQSY